MTDIFSTLSPALQNLADALGEWNENISPETHHGLTEALKTLGDVIHRVKGC